MTDLRRLVVAVIAALAVAATVVVVGVATAPLAQAQVTATVNSADGGALSTAGVCTLHEAIQSAHGTANSSGCPPNATVITFDHSAMGGSTITLSQALPSITSSSLTFNGDVNGTKTTIRGTTGLRVFDINAAGAVVNFNDLIIRDGDFAGLGAGIQINQGTVTVTTSEIRDNTATSSGGGINITSGQLTVADSVISNNRGTSGGGIRAAFATLIVNNTNISNNKATNDGGGISVGSGSATVTGGVMHTNAADDDASGSGDGGGIAVDSGSLGVTGATVTNNTAHFGGGISVGANATLELREAEISDNTSASSGGGIRLSGGASGRKMLIERSAVIGNTSSSASGGGVAVSGAGSTPNLIVNSTISGNNASLAGGIFNGSGVLTVLYSTVTNNSAPSAAGIQTFSGVSTQVAGSIVHGNTGGDGIDVTATLSSGFSTGCANVIGTFNIPVIANCLADPGGTQMNLDALNADNVHVLKTNGDLTAHGIDPQPAIDLFGESAPTVDQLGNPRDPSITPLDSGAYENQLPTVTPAAALTAPADQDLFVTFADMLTQLTVVDPEGDQVRVGEGTSTVTSQGGSLQEDSPLEFTYTPPAGFTGSDTATVGVSDRSSCCPGQATVNIIVGNPSCTIGSAMVFNTNLTAPECAALEALYDDTGGATTWTNTGGSNGDAWSDIGAVPSASDPCNWDGIICTSGKVTGLNLSFNGLSGEIPVEIGALTALTILNLSFNGLSGEIPVEIGALTALTALNLSGNGLSGEIPVQIGALTALTFLDLSGSGLSGEIPVEIGALTALSVLDLSFNGLSGEIPVEIGALTALTILDLRGNGLSGEIPVEIGALTALSFALLDNNQCLTANAATETFLGGVSTTDASSALGSVACDAVDDSATVTTPGSVAVDVVANDGLRASPIDSLTVTSPPATGTTSVVSGQITYTAPAGTATSDSFDYQVCSGTTCTTATVTVTLVPNTAPVAVDDAVSTGFETAVVVNVVDGSAGGADVDVDGDALTVTAVSGFTDGMATFSGQDVTYTPDAGFSGSDTVTYTVSDGTATATADVVVTVGAATNTAPVAVDDAVSTGFETAVVVNVVDGSAGGVDTDVDGDALTVTAVSGFTDGTVMFVGPEITYTPDAGFSGSDTVTYTVSDGTATATADLVVTVAAAAVFCDGKVVTINMNLAGVTGIGSADDDVILGTPGPDVIDGMGGDDTICGEAGDDNISGSDGKDFLFGGDGDDTLSGGPGNDRIRGQKGIDTITGGDGNDFLYGGIDGDTINGGDGNDTIGGFGGADIIDAGPGNDLVFGGFGADTIHGGAGNDRLNGLIGNDVINGDGGNDIINGGSGQDTLNGNGGDDTISGGNSLDTLNGNGGDDTLKGGKSDDTLSGGPGTDTCTGNTEAVADVADATCEQTFGIP